MNVKHSKCRKIEYQNFCSPEQQVLFVWNSISCSLSKSLPISTYFSKDIKMCTLFFLLTALAVNSFSHALRQEFWNIEAPGYNLVPFSSSLYLWGIENGSWELECSLIVHLSPSPIVAKCSVKFVLPVLTVLKCVVSWCWVCLHCSAASLQNFIIHLK